MATTTEISKLTSSLADTQYDFDPDGTTATDVAWVDMQEFESILFAFFRTVGTSDITVQVLANSQSIGGGTDVVVKSLSNSDLGDPDAVGDTTFVEVTAAQIAAEAAKAGVKVARYVSLNVAFATGTDEAVITYIRGLGNGRASLTARKIA